MKPVKFKNNRVLIVDDQKEIHDDFAEMLKPIFGQPPTHDLESAFVSEEQEQIFPEFELLHATNGEEAYEIIRSGKASNCPVAVAYIDIRMPPGIDGIETVRRVRGVDRDVEIIVMTAYADYWVPEIIHGMELLHKLLYIRKPFSHEEIQQITLCLVGKWNIERELAEKRRQLAISNRRLEAVINATGDALAMHDIKGYLVFANKLYEKLMDLKESELKKMPPGNLAARFEEQFREPDLGDVEGKFLLDGENVVEATRAGRVPEQRLFYRIAAPVRDSQGEVIGSLVVCRDVSNEIEAEKMKTEVLRLRTELERSGSFAGMVGDSPKMRQVYALMKQAAESDASVLIGGESGTGKELVARSFHLNSPRRKGPFVTLNCANISESLMARELFGHERGAFPEATKRRIGAFERAASGTILLEDIGNLSYALQGRLLHVLQEGEITRVGGTTPVRLDVRVISATDRDLEAAVEAGEFREDLFRCVAAFPILIPPLRERREDIPVLAMHFLKKYAASADKSISGIANAALRLLLQYNWPGNVRELENAIERAVLLESTNVLQACSLPHQLSAVAAGGGDRPVPDAVLPLAVVEHQALLHALQTTGNPADAARALGINRATLNRKLKKYGIPGD